MQRKAEPDNPQDTAVDNTRAGVNQPQAKQGRRKRQRTPAQIWLAAQIAPEKTRLAWAARLHGLSELLWIAQAAILAMGFTLVSSASWAYREALIYAACLLALTGLRAALRHSANKLAQESASNVRTRLHARLAKALVTASPALPVPASGKMAALIVDHVHAVGPYISRYLPLQPRLAIVPLGILAAIACVSWFAALMLLLIGPLVPLFMALVGIRAKKASDDQHGLLADMSALLLDRLRGLETLRLFGALKATETTLDEHGNAFRRATMRVLRIAFLSSTSLELFAAAGIAITAIYVGFSLLGHWNFGSYGDPITLGSGLFILVLVPEFFGPLRLFALAYHDKVSAASAAELLCKAEEELQQAKPAHPVNSVPSATVQLFSGTLALENVSISRGGKTVLQEQSFTFPRSGLVVLSGASGMGKTTLLDSLVGFLLPDSGAITVDGKPLSAENVKDWQQSIASISQQPQLFHGTVRSNLHRAAPSASDEELLAALKLSGADEILAKLPGGLAGPIGEEGAGLSMGEMRRFAIARAALRKDAPLVLADEPTADLDGVTAAKVTAALKQLSQHHLVVAATHDTAVQSAADMILDLLDGRLQARPPAPQGLENTPAQAKGEPS
ncbi:thiol reductant ABC exporter subunit CydD [Polycladidibacter hongkongensis]|uniref:thiol reductant ABC exporter subunit CydD n=1 Tax=Polycladidibacter hongkongensis TaxID=1647556 RepID=UPI00082C648B|nr:thiol reductant ABC exporter subunit CydD [Pseudovibrio hongkongensis]